MLKDPNGQKNAHKKPGTPSQSPSSPITKRAASSRKVIEAPASAQCAKLDAQAEERRHTAEHAAKAKPSPGTGKRERKRPRSRRAATIEGAIADYLVWYRPDEDRPFLSETRLPLTKNGAMLLFKRIRQRAGTTEKRK